MRTSASPRTAFRPTFIVHLQLAVRPYRLRLRQPLRTSQWLFHEREGGVLRLLDDKGREGFGEICPLPGGGHGSFEDAVTSLGTREGHFSWEELESLSADVECLRAALAAARRMMEQPGSRDARNADAPPTGPASWPVAALLPGGRTVLTEIERWLEMGFRVFKWKVGLGNPGDELALLDDLFARLPTGARVRLDANGAWDRRLSERWLDRCAERPVEHVEQPIDPGKKGAEDLLSGLSNDYPTPLALDESIRGERDASAWLDRGWTGVFVLKPSLLGSPHLILAKLAQARAKVVFSSALETAVGARNALELAFMWPGERRALGFGVWPLFQDGRFDGPPAAPFLHWSDVKRLDPKSIWTALA